MITFKLTDNEWKADIENPPYCINVKLYNVRNLYDTVISQPILTRSIYSNL